MDTSDELLAILQDLERIEEETRASIKQLQAETVVHLQGIRERVICLRGEARKNKELNEIVMRALMGNLTLHQKRIIMFKIAGLTDREMASELKTTLSAVRVIQKRITQKFRTDNLEPIIAIFARLIDRM